MWGGRGIGGGHSFYNLWASNSKFRSQDVEYFGGRVENGFMYLTRLCCVPCSLQHAVVLYKWGDEAAVENVPQQANRDRDFSMNSNQTPK